MLSTYLENSQTKVMLVKNLKFIFRFFTLFTVPKTV